MTLFVNVGTIINELAFLSYGNMMEWVSISGRQHTNCFVGVPCFSVDGYDL